MYMKAKKSMGCRAPAVEKDLVLIKYQIFKVFQSGLDRLALVPQPFLTHC